ncbi:MAG: AbrB/MazE/SpoVT family DNA-binding domain-containing protein [Proteobacteria bacterium]|nr:AbrB/MazE/SpoVT family DNA-binding domain-containing protein [Pseudomonadota bacterium]
MVELIKIGNSQGIRIPKPLIEQAQLENHILNLKITEEGLLISPVKKARGTWENSVKEAITKYETISPEEREWLGITTSTDDDWQW